MQRGEMVQYVPLLVFVGMSVTQGQANEDIHNWIETPLHIHNSIKNNDIPMKPDASSNPTTGPATEDTSSPISEPTPLSPGYKPATEFGSKVITGHYKFYTKENDKNWFEAFKTCKNEGSHLFMINNAPESRAVVYNMAMAESFGDWHWVGVHDGGSLISKETTESGTIYKCQAVRYSIIKKPPIKFERFDCDEKKSFICEMGTLT